MNWLRNFMMGRYGLDQMTGGLLVGMMGFSLLSSLTWFLPLYLISIALMIWAVFRVFSRNTAARARENEKFLVFWNQVKKWWNGVRQWFAKQKRKWDDRKTHVYFRCPNCKKELRVPKGKGKLEVTCPLCRSKFIKKT